MNGNLPTSYFKLSKYNQWPFDKVCDGFGVDTITGRKLISKYYGDLINPELILTREDLITSIVSTAKRQPVHLYGPVGCGKTTLAISSAEELGKPFIFDLGDHRTGEKLKPQILDLFLYPENVLVLENVDHFDGRSHRTLTALLTEAKARIILTSVKQQILPSVMKLVAGVYVARPEINDVMNFVQQKFPSWKGDTEYIYEHCKGDMRRIIRCITDEIVDHNIEDEHVITPQHACGLILYEKDREKVLRELHNIEGNNWFYTIQFLRQNIQYCFREKKDREKAADALALIDQYKFVINKEVLLSLLSAFPLSPRKLPKIYFPSNPRKKPKEEKEPDMEKIKKTKRKKKVKKTGTLIDYANVL